MFANMTNMQSNHYQSQRLETLGLMASGIVHDFNNLLTSIVGQASLALTKLPPGSDARLHVERTIQAAHYASLLTRQLLAYSRGDNTKLEMLDINQLIEDNVGLLKLVFLSGVTVQLDLSPHLLLVQANRAQLQQVLMNLLINAAEATQTLPGTIAVRTGKWSFPSPQKHVFIGNKEPVPGNYLFIEVCDCGSGMDEATLARIFDPFFSTKPNGQGLGLSAVLEIIHTYHGVITVQSKLHHGTTFTMFLPIISRELNNFPPPH